MICPHCLIGFHEEWKETGMGKDSEFTWTYKVTQCSECKRFVIYLGTYTGPYNSEKNAFLVYPKAISRSPLPKEVPEKYAEDYKEACLVLADSPKASAALSRRCLQNLLREVAGVKPDDLSKEIQEVINSGKLPSDLSEAIDAIRNIGNFATHPNKSKHTGEIYDVEPGEAEWSLDVLEGLFDFYFVRPTKLKEKKDALNKKLKNGGKPEMK
ncbi:MAG: DUF4145 domain-containing protein [Dehalococcoidia bacterium]|nr:DUF4145 domain-containing protein [Dehalococcoidia bacterium]